MVSLIATTMPIMDDSRTMPSFGTSTTPISRFPSVTSVLTSQMRILRKLSGISRRLHTKAIDMSLWPYALRQVYRNDYLVPRDSEGMSKIDIFRNLHVNANLESTHTIGCLVYVLDSRLASGMYIKRSDSLARLGINRG
ncbi:hypothetical protein ACHAWF_001969 [Thalassiosira exigua]